MALFFAALKREFVSLFRFFFFAMPSSSVQFLQYFSENIHAVNFQCYYYFTFWELFTPVLIYDYSLDF